MPSRSPDERYNLWNQFLNRWTPQTLADMSLSQYHTANDPTQDNLVNWLEIRTESLGSIWGGSGFKFGIYNRADHTLKNNGSGLSYSKDYGWYTKYGFSPDEAFLTVRSTILDIVSAAQQADILAIDQIDFSPAIKWKLAFLYQPQNNIFMPAIYKTEMLQRILSTNDSLSIQKLYYNIMQNWDKKNIFSFTDELLKKINLEESFKNWLTNKLKNSGTPYKLSTINQYIRTLKTVTAKIEDIEVTHTNLFYYTNLSAFAKVYDIIIAATNFNTVNSECGHGTYAAGIAQYKKFLEEYDQPTNSVNNNDNISTTMQIAHIKDTTRHTHYTLQTISDEGCFLPFASLEQMFSRLHDKKNIILQGPPGTGKSWLAKRLAWALTGQKSNTRVQALQFHATLSYEDFVCGWRPVGDGKLELQDGPFLEALAMATADPTPYALVIEEINRGNPAQIFGELLTLLETDKRMPEEALRLCYQKSGECRAVHLPPNLYLIGTMNIADRSLAIVDFALRRRFAFFDIPPHFGMNWQNWMCTRAGLSTDFVTALGNAMLECNNAIANDPSLGPQYAIGHSFVTNDTPIANPRAWIEGIVATEITPLLKEYWFNDLKKANETSQAILDALP